MTTPRLREPVDARPTLPMRSCYSADRNANRALPHQALALPLLLLVVSTGCRIPAFIDPAPKSLVESRQLSQRGINAIERDDWKAAEQLLVEAVDRCPICPDARRHYAKTLWQQGRSEEALVQIDEALRLSVDDPTLLVESARMRFTLGDLQRAMEHVQLALDLDHHYAAAWTLRGRILQQQGQPHEALADYQRALQYDANNEETLVLVAKLYAEMGQPHRALANLRHLRDQYEPGTEPEHLMYLLAANYSTTGRYNDAALCLRQATAQGPTTPEMLYRLAQVELASGHFSEAQQAAAKALAMEPQHAASRAILQQAEVAMHSDPTVQPR